MTNKISFQSIFTDIVKLAQANGIIGQGLRFLLSGGLNTIITLAIYELMLFYVSASTSYVVAWVAGVLITGVIYPLFVFNNTIITLKKSLLHIVYYVASFLASLGIFQIIINLNIIPERLVPIVVLLIITPVTFFVSRLIFYKK